MGLQFMLIAKTSGKVDSVVSLVDRRRTVVPDIIEHVYQ